MKRDEIALRDPYILFAENKYYLYGTRSATAWGPADGFDAYMSKDLENWDGPAEIFHNNGKFWATENYWAPECIFYRGNYYLIATFGNPDRKKGIQFLRADNPLGPFEPFTEGTVTPAEWNCIDGTFYQDDEGIPWLIFSHSLPEEPRGAVCAVRMTTDLSRYEGIPQVLFYADEAAWARPVPFAKEEFGLDGKVYFTDGPFVFRDDEKRLMMIWSGWGDSGYAIGTAISESGKITGPWIQKEKPLYGKNGGHGMIFRAGDGKLKLVLHYPNDRLKERPIIIDYKDDSDLLN